jgi:membrane protein
MNDAVAQRVTEHRSREPGRGREASKPKEIPASGWKDIAYRVWDEIGNDRVGTIAAGTTFFVLLALFPAIAALVSIYGLVADPATIQDHLNDVAGYVPAEMLSLVSDQLKRLSTTEHEALGFGFVLGLLLALYSANNGVKALFDALNVAYDEEEKRNFIQLNLRSFAFTLGAIVFAILVANVVIGIPIVVNFVNLGAVGRLLITVLPAVVLFAVASFGISLLYRYGPSRSAAQWRWITPGSLAAALIWLLGSAAFTYYLANFGDYSATYGSLGAVIGAMMWIYISMWIILVGAELNSEIEHQTAKDTTTGPEKPLGSRGATMADRVGEARA